MQVTASQPSSLPSILGAVLLLVMATDGQAFPAFHPSNCANCHQNPILAPTPADAATLSFGSSGFTLVGQSSLATWTLKNNRATTTGNGIGAESKGGGFSGSFPTTSAGGGFSADPATTIIGVNGYLTPQLFQSHSYTYTPATRGQNSQDISFTPTNGFSGTPPTVTITLQGQGVAPLLSLAGSQTSAGNVRLGTSGAAASLRVTNVGDGNLSGVGADSNLRGDVSQVGGAFAGGPASFSLPDGASQQTGFTFTPTVRGQATAALTVATVNGHADGSNQAEDRLLELDGFGVGPQFGASIAPGATIDFGDVMTQQIRALSVVNATPDADLGALTDLGLLSLQITGPDASFFSLSGFTPGTVLSQGSSLDVDVLFTNNATAGPRSATLLLRTDEGAAPGQSGAEFSYALAANGVAAAVPEPETIAMLLAGLGVIVLRVGAMRRRSRR